MISIEEINKLINNLWGDSGIGKTIADVEYVQKLKTAKLYLENNPSEKSLRRQLSDVNIKMGRSEDKNEIIMLKKKRQLILFILNG